MKKTIIILVLCMAFSLAAMAEGNKYHLATSPSRGFFESRNSGRAGCTPASSVRTYKTGNMRTSGSFVSKTDLLRRRSTIRYSRQAVSSTSKRLSLNNHSGGTTLVSTDVGLESASAGGGGGGGATSSSVFGRTGGGLQETSVTPAFTGLSTLPESLATTTRGDSNYSDDGDDEQDFGAPPMCGTPLGDAILPMLLLISLVTLCKWKFKR